MLTSRLFMFTPQLGWSQSRQLNSPKISQFTMRIFLHCLGLTTRTRRWARMKANQSVLLKRLNSVSKLCDEIAKMVIFVLLSIQQNLNSSTKSSSSADGPKFPGDKTSAQNNNQQKKGIQVLPDGELLFMPSCLMSSLTAQFVCYMKMIRGFRSYLRGS